MGRLVMFNELTLDRGKQYYQVNQPRLRRVSHTGDTLDFMLAPIID